MGYRIKPGQLNAVSKELAEDIGPFARSIAQRLGIEMGSMTKEEAAVVRAAAKDPEVLKEAGKSFGSKAKFGDGPAAVAEGLATEPVPQAPPHAGPMFGPPSEAGAVRARLALPPPDAPPPGAMVPRPRTDLAPQQGGMPAPAYAHATYEEPAGALARIKPDVVDAEIVGGSPRPQGALPGTPERLALPPGTPEAGGINKKALAAGAVLAGGAAAAALSGGDKTVQPATEGEVPKDLAGGSGTGAATPPPVTPAGRINPKYVTTLPTWAPSKYDGPAMPGAETAQEGRQIMKAAQDDLVAATNRLVDEYRGERDSLKQREIWEGIIQSVGLIAAGAYGLHNGVDMSGVKFSPTDWVAQQESLRRSHDTLMGAEKDKFGAREKYATAVDRDEDQRWQRNAKVYEAAATAYNHKIDDEFRTWQGKVKGVELKNQAAHWDAELDLAYQGLGVKLANADTAAAARVAAAQRKDLDKAKSLGTKAQALLGRAATAKDSDVGTMMLQQAKQLSDEAEALTGKPAIPAQVFLNPRGGNSVFQLGFGENKPEGQATPAQAVKTLTELNAPGAAPAAKPAPAAATISPAKLNAYATAHQMTPAAAAAFLKSQGYSVGQ